MLVTGAHQRVRRARGDTGGPACHARRSARPVGYDRAMRDPVVGPEGLRGRASERALLNEVIGAVRAGASRTLLIHGEAGIGKTALLNYAVDSAPGMRVLRAAGIESEMELAFASLQQLC